MIPQFMPLMWINSIEISFLIMMTLFNLYNLKEEFNLVSIEGDKYNCMIKLMW